MNKSEMAGNTESNEENESLIKVDNHYVPWTYRYYSDTKQKAKMAEEHYEDVYAYLPTIGWCDTCNKFKVMFASADSGGHDVIHLVWYFDTIDDILKEMGFDKHAKITVKHNNI